jgi:beta-lactamase superfamily II metal-dependent hydrolase
MSIVQELERLFMEAEKARIWGMIQIDLQAGKAVVIRQTVTRKLYDDGSNHNDRNR